MDYRVQTAMFFARERHMCNQGFNPKSDFKPHHVTKEDIKKMFGVCFSYKSTNHVLLLKTREELLTFYKKVYGSSTVTHNEFMKWFMIGFIVEAKGFLIDWATTTTTIVKEKSRLKELEKFRSNKSNGDALPYAYSKNSNAKGAKDPSYLESDLLMKIKACNSLHDLIVMVEELWPKVYQRYVITNGEISLFFAKGFLAQKKQYQVNWASFAT